MKSRYTLADPALLELHRNRPHRAYHPGLAVHVSIAQHPRLILEIPRGSDRYRQLHALRSASERTNSTLKDGTALQPPVRSVCQPGPGGLPGGAHDYVDPSRCQIYSGSDGEGGKIQAHGRQALVRSAFASRDPGSPQTPCQNRLTANATCNGMVSSFYLHFRVGRTTTTSKDPQSEIDARRMIPRVKLSVSPGEWGSSVATSAKFVALWPLQAP